jgi:ribosome-associated protein
LCGFCDYILIAHGNSDRQVQALADRIDKDVTTKLRRKPLGVEGRKEGQWILMDYGDVVVHLFLEELRSFYALESMWHDAPLEAIGSVTKKPAARKTRKDL